MWKRAASFLHRGVAPAEFDADFVQLCFQGAVESVIRGGRRPHRNRSSISSERMVKAVADTTATLGNANACSPRPVDLRDEIEEAGKVGELTVEAQGGITVNTNAKDGDSGSDIQ